MNFFRDEKDMKEYISNLEGIKDTIYALDLEKSLEVADKVFGSKLFENKLFI